jgi:ligand-binding SRPBCC domain-containing protein
MAVVRTTTLIHAPVNTVFTLARDVAQHAAALVTTGERAVEPGRTEGLLELGDLYCLRAKHLGLPWSVDVRIITLDEDELIASTQIRGPFRRLEHEHRFVVTGAGTLLTDEVRWVAPAGLLGKLADEIVLRRRLLWILTVRNAHLKRWAEVRAARAHHCSNPHNPSLTVSGRCQ